MTDHIEAIRVRYIKLGEGGSWADECIADGILRIGFYTDHFFDLCLARKWQELSAAYLKEGLSQSTATRFTGEVQAVYEDPGTTLWITFHALRMYWTRIDPNVVPRRAEQGEGTFRTTRGGWSSRTLGGHELYLVDLSGNLTKTAGYRGTSCDITDIDYVVRRINGLERPEVSAAKKLVSELSEVVIQMMRLLTPRDFELLVELLFSSSGWRRLGATGKTQKTVDLELELPSTQERAFVQVKSATNQAVFDSYRQEFTRSELQRMFFAYHSGSVTNSDTSVTVLGPKELSRMVLDAGLVSWLVNRVG